MKENSRSHEKERNWYDRMKREHINPVTKALSENIPTIVAVTTSLIALGLMIKSSTDAEESNKKTKDILENIENKIETAIEAPTIVRVELGDDMELFGTGNRTE